MGPIATQICTFLAGVFVGAAGTYLADRFTDRRRERETDRKQKKQFAEAEALMPDLIAEMREDVLADATGIKREFFPYNDGQIFAPGDCFFYSPDKHAGLANKLGVLESRGYVVDVAVSDTARYRMTEDFVRLLRNKKNG